MNVWRPGDDRAGALHANEAAAKTTHKYWVAFAKTGKPEPMGEPAWPAYNAKTDRIRRSPECV
jgi:para-nitrobenzyl esterase